jgi:hypothetical protein
MLLEQFRRVLGAAPPRIGLVISGWDRLPLEEQQSGPLEHLRVEQKLLHDFIVSNGTLNIQPFGVTLFGGDLNNPAFQASFGDHHPRDRGAVWHELNGVVECSNDLALPVAWALSVAP